MAGNFVEFLPAGRGQKIMLLGVLGQGHGDERFPCFGTIFPVYQDVVRGTLVLGGPRLERAFVVKHIFKGEDFKFSCSFSLVLSLNEVAQFVVSNDFFVFVVPAADQKLDLLMVFGVEV